MFRFLLVACSFIVCFSQFSLGLRSNHYFSNEKLASNSSVSFLAAQYINFKPVGLNLELSHDHFILPMRYRALSQTSTDIETSFFDVEGSYLSGSISLGYELKHFFPMVGLAASYGSLTRVKEEENRITKIKDGSLELFYLFALKYKNVDFIHENLGFAFYYQIPIRTDELESREKLSYQSLHVAIYYEFN